MWRKRSPRHEQVFSKRTLRTAPASNGPDRKTKRGSFTFEEPAAVLFADFDVLCREVTFAFYQAFIGPEVRRDHLLPMTDVDQKRKVLDETVEAARRYWTTIDFCVRPFRINAYSAIFELPPHECLTRLKRARTALESTQQTIRDEYRRLRESEQTISNARAGRMPAQSRLPYRRETVWPQEGQSRRSTRGLPSGDSRPAGNRSQTGKDRSRVRRPASKPLLPCSGTKRSAFG